MYAAFGDAEAAIRLLRIAFEVGDPQMVVFGSEPTFEPLRGDPRFVSLLESLRLPAGVVR